MIADDFQLEHIDRRHRWADVFNTIDENFDKIKLYLARIGSRIKVNTFTALAGEQEFFLDSEYNTRNNSLMVYYNGVRQFLGTGFIETSKNSFKLVDPAEDGDVIVAVFFNYFLPDDTRTVDQRFIDEIEEARVGIDGTMYASLSEAIRNQILRYNTDFASQEEINGLFRKWIQPYLGNGAGDMDVVEGENPVGPSTAITGFGNITATVDDQSGTPSVNLVLDGPNNKKDMQFEFHNLKGQDGIDGGGSSIEFPITVEQGGTGAETADGARKNLGVPGIPVKVEEGGTGAENADDAKTNLGIEPIPLADLDEMLGE